MSKLGLRLHADEEHWIPLSDLMTGLMFLFLVVALAYMVAAEQKNTQRMTALRNYVGERAQIYNQLKTALGPRLQRWNATIDPSTLSIRFSGNTGLFAPGSADILPQFQRALTEFFPRYLSILSQHRSAVGEVRIEGYTSTRWPRGTLSGKYLDDMTLSQARARSVLQYVMALPSVEANKTWLRQVVSADGFAYSHLVRAKNGLEDSAASDRVEFRVLNDANAKIAALVRSSATSKPAPKATATPVPPPTLGERLPPYPPWAQNLIGTPLKKAFPKTALRCFGYLDVIEAYYAGPPAGAEVSGWAFDMDAWQPVKRVVLVDVHGTIVGAADGGLARADVQKSVGWVTSPNVGWHGYAAATNAAVTPWAVMPAPRTACRLNVAGTLANQRM